MEKRLQRSGRTGRTGWREGRDGTHGRDGWWRDGTVGVEGGRDRLPAVGGSFFST